MYCFIRRRLPTLGTATNYLRKGHQRTSRTCGILLRNSSKMKKVLLWQI